MSVGHRCGRPLTVAAVVATIVAVGCTNDQLREDTGSTALKELPAFGSRTCKAVGTVFTEGLLVLSNTSAPDADVTLESVEQEIDGGSLEPLGVVIAGPDRRFVGTQFAVDFPPTKKMFGEMSAVSGFHIPAGGWGERRGAEVLFGYRVVSEGQAKRQLVDVNYTVDGEAQSVTYRAKLAVRTPSEADRSSCR